MINCYNTESKVEEFFSQKNYLSHQNESHWKIPTVIVDNYVELGQLTALCFWEWVILNPGGVVALPTGKMPEFFIKWMEYYLNNWKTKVNSELLARHCFEPHKKPYFKSLHFFQLDEFSPSPPDHERSFHYFVQNYYIKGFGFDPVKTHTIDTYKLDQPTRKLLDNKKNWIRPFKTSRLT
jgi:glucosamine-6-phosphate deaminase